MIVEAQRGPTRVSVHRDNLAKGLPAVWLLEVDGVLYSAEGWRAAGPAKGAAGEASYGAKVWVEVYGPVTLTGAVPASS